MDKYFEDYKKKITPLIENVIQTPGKPYIYEPRIFSTDSIEYKHKLQIAHEIKQTQMKEGKIAEILISNWYGWTDLKTNGPRKTGLDCYKLDNSAIMEVKNKHNTCNSSSQQVLLDKLSKYKKEHPKTECIWGVINPKLGDCNLTKTIVHKGVEIKKLQGLDLLSYVFTHNEYDYSLHVIKYIKFLLSK